MPRNLVICFDGTNNNFGYQNTNVVRLVQTLLRDPSKQHLYYDPGVGTLPAPGVWSTIGKRTSEIWELAFGTDLTRKVEQAYSWLMDSWHPDDIVFLFGFSRGAYTARVLAGLLHALGLLPAGAYNMIPYAMKLYRAIREQGDPRSSGGSSGSGVSKYWRLCDEFRWTFARPIRSDDEERRFCTRFLGLWDTVSSVGWVWDPASFQFTARNPSVKIARHAISIDERRAFFRQNRLLPVDGQDLQQRWFAGVHCDVGGGYELLFSNPPPVYSRLWLHPFQWMINEARIAGALIDDERLASVLSACPASARPWVDPQHESLTLVWWPMEWFPKLKYSRRFKHRMPHLNCGRHRAIDIGELIDQWALCRIQDTDYAPPNLSPRFCNTVRALPKGQIPDFMAYQP